MKVSFKLNKEQLIAAKKLVAEVANVEAEDHEVWCGNLLGFQGHTFNFNSDQHLQLLDNGIVQYIGQRHPLIQDGGMTLLAEIAGFNEPFPWEKDYNHPVRVKWHEDRLKAVKNLVVSEYETSDPDLTWWEVAEDKATRIIAQGKVTTEMLSPIVDRCFKTSRLTKAEFIYLDTLEKIKPAPLGSAAYRQACAAGTQDIQLLAAKYQEAKVSWN